MVSGSGHKDTLGFSSFPPALHIPFKGLHRVPIPSYPKNQSVFSAQKMHKRIPLCEKHDDVDSPPADCLES